jgi:hypothetical protein
MYFSTLARFGPKTSNSPFAKQILPKQKHLYSKNKSLQSQVLAKTNRDNRARHQSQV